MKKPKKNFAAPEKGSETPHPRYHTAQQLYTEAQLSLKEIASALDLPAPTLAKWCKDNNWNRQRDAHQTMPQRLSERLQQVAMRILEISETDYKTFAEADAAQIVAEISVLNKVADSIAKISRSIVSINSRMDESAAIQTMIRFDKHLIAEGALDLAKEIKPYQQTFMKGMRLGVES